MNDESVSSSSDIHGYQPISHSYLRYGVDFLPSFSSLFLTNNLNQSNNNQLINIDGSSMADIEGVGIQGICLLGMRYLIFLLLSRFFFTYSLGFLVQFFNFLCFLLQLKMQVIYVTHNHRLDRLYLPPRTMASDFRSHLFDWHLLS